MIKKPIWQVTLYTKSNGAYYWYRNNTSMHFAYAFCLNSNKNDFYISNNFHTLIEHKVLKRPLIFDKYNVITL